MNGGPVVRSISLSELSEAISQSIKAGKKHYGLFFLAAVLAATLAALQNSVGGFAISVLTMIGFKVYGAGVVAVSQHAAESGGSLTANMFAWTFKSERGLRQTLKAIAVDLIPSGFIMLLAIVLTVSMVASDPRGTEMAEKTMILASVVALATVVITLPFRMVLQLLLLRDLTWRQSLSLSVSAFFKNLPVYLLYLLPALPGLSILLIPNLGRPFADAEIIKGISVAIQYVLSFFVPYFMILDYLLYKKFFRFDSPDFELLKPQV